jgi:hypothetical protein
MNRHGEGLNQTLVILMKARAARRLSTSRAARKIRKSWVLGSTNRHTKNQIRAISSNRKTKCITPPAIKLKYIILSDMSSENYPF